MLDPALHFNALPNLTPHEPAPENAALLCLVPVNSALDASHLSTYERTQLEKRRQPSAKAEYLTSRWLIKSLIKYVFDDFATVAAAELSTEFVEADKALTVFYQERRLDVRVVLSHSWQHVGVCIIKGEHNQLGLDIEYTKKQRDFKKLAAHFYHPSECALIGEHSAHFYRIWTLKEAYAKASKRSIASLLSQPILPALSGSNLAAYCGHWQDFDVTLLAPKQCPVYLLNSSILSAGGE